MNNDFKWLNHHARTSALIYAEAILEACAKLRITDPLMAIVDADDFPALRDISEAEFAIGWLHGCAECHGVTIDALWVQVGFKRPSRAGKKGRAA